MVTVEVSHLTASYGSVQALKDVSLTLEKGSIYGLIGMNGSGKSTLFKTLMGIHKEYTGSVTIAGVSSQQARSSGVLSYVPQSEEIDFTFPISVREIVAMGTYPRLGPTRRLNLQAQEAVDYALERVELSDYADRQIGALSGGQKKRAFVARAMAQEASIFFLDEPFAGVDKRSEAMMIKLFKELADQGSSILVSTHDLASLDELANQAILLRQSILMQGDVEQVLRPENLVKAFGMDVLGENR